MKRYWHIVVIVVLLLNTIFILVFSRIHFQYVEQKLALEVNARMEAEKKAETNTEDAMKQAQLSEKLASELEACKAGK